MILQTIIDHDALTAPATERAYELADMGMVDMTGSWVVTVKGFELLKGVS